MDQDWIIVENGDMFEGTREQFADCYFSNADNHNIIEWCEENEWSLTINGEKFLTGKNED